MTQTLTDLLTERVSLFAAGDKPREIIDQNVEKMFREVINDCFRSYGDMGKAVSAAIKEAMPSNVSGMFELTRYNAMIEASLRTQWQSSGIEGDMLRRANECMKAALAETALPAVISLRNLLEEFASCHKEDAANERWEAPEIRIENSEYGPGVNIYFDEKPESEHQATSFGRHREARHNYSLKNRIHVRWNADDATDANGNHVGEVFAAQIDGDPIGRTFCIRNDWERMVAALYFGAAKVAIDCDADDISYGLDY